MKRKKDRVIIKNYKGKIPAGEVLYRIFKAYEEMKRNGR